MRYLLTIVLIFSQALAFAQGIPEKPSQKRLVNDFTGTTLSSAEANTLEQKLLNYEDTTSTQVAILIVESLNGYEVVDFGVQTFNSWKIGGSAEKNNGILILVSINDRKAAIVTGYGMEGAITDAATYTIREDYMNPRFREGNFYQGLDDATTVIFKLASGEYTSDDVASGRTGDGGSGFPFFTLFILFFFIIPALVGKRRGNSHGSRGIPWWAWLMMGSGGGNHNDKWDNFRGGGGSFGGGSGFGGGGGFGGFGGGMSGGGGSGGSW